MRYQLAKIIGAISTCVLKNLLRRQAANFPGKAGLVVDPNLIAHLRPRISEGTVVVVGTNGKTTVTNLLADALEASGKVVACNRTGANLDSGVASALLHTATADWGVFESDELWLPKITPQLQPEFVVLLNLFRDQLDRAGEIDNVQKRIVEALASSPSTTLVYNADDPFCQAIADQTNNASIPFGIAQDLQLAQNAIVDSGLCQHCDTPLDYTWRQYGQLGNYCCPNCGFAREELAYGAYDVHLDAQGTTFSVRENGNPRDAMHVRAPVSSAYMAYNLLATCVAAGCCNVPFESTDKAIRSFSPENGRLQTYSVDGCRTLLNLAKNPVGLNQNLRIIASSPGPKAAAFFINDKEADGHDVSWLWDVDFEELAQVEDLLIFAGGIRRNDLQVRLKYAGIEAQLVEGARDFATSAHAVSPNAELFLVANYTALSSVKSELNHMACEQDAATCCPVHEPLATHVRRDDAGAAKNAIEHPCPHLSIVHLYPELLNLYGDGGNVTILADRARKRGIAVDVVRALRGSSIDFAGADIVFLGGGPDREQRVASESLLEQADDLRAYVEDDGVLLAICGGFQIIGTEWLLCGETVRGLGLVDIATGRAKGESFNRIVGNVMLESPLASMPVIGYENHAGRTYLGAGCEPFGRVVGNHGTGNNDTDGVDGVRYRNVVGTYLHGPLLAKNPEIADWLIERALARRAAKENQHAPQLTRLDDAEERAANEFMRHRLDIRR